MAITSKSYGHALKGVKIYYEGLRPKGLRDDGSIKFGKNMLEAFRRQLGHKYIAVAFRA